MTCSWHISFPNTGHTDWAGTAFYCYSAHTLSVSDTHRGRQPPADAGHSPAGSRWGIEAAGRSWKRSMQSRPGWSGKSPARRSTDAGTWDKKEGGWHGYKRRGMGGTVGGRQHTQLGLNRRKHITKVHGTYCTSFHLQISKQVIFGWNVNFHSIAKSAVIWV